VNPGAVTIRPATLAEHEPAVHLLADAFEHDPAIVAATTQASSPDIARHAIFRMSLATTLMQGGTLLVAEDSGALLGAAIIRDPATSRLSDCVGQVRAGLSFLRLRSLLGTDALLFLNRADRASRRHAPRAPHHVLIAVGVTSEARGRGVGRALVEASVQRASEHPTSYGVSLETENRANADRYARWQFELLASVEVDPVTVHVMARPTRDRKNGAP
jgi:GNAT superfamily N-acetyltransferase